MQPLTASASLRSVLPDMQCSMSLWVCVLVGAWMGGVSALRLAPVPAMLLALAMFLARGASAQDARFECPGSSCWCQDTYSTAEISVHKNSVTVKALND